MATEYISTETGCQYLRKYKIEDGTSFLYDEGFNDGIETAISCIGNEIPAADVVPWEWLERYADYFCAGVSMPEFVREAKMFYEGTNEAMKGGVIDG